MNGSKQKYRLDEYLQDKAARAAQPLLRGGASGVGQNAVATPTNSSAVPTVKGMAVKPPHVVQKPASNGAAAVSAGQNVTVDIANPDTGASAGGGTLTQSQMTTAYTKQLLENALAMLAELPNRKFTYDAHSSPLYSIVQKQAEENARLASGRAYAQAKAATGGYGSSYATLAADEASRQAMRELDDQQLALYEAARAEFEAENASMLDWYNTARQLHADAASLEEEQKAESGMTQSASEAAQYLLNTYGVAYSEQAMRQDLLGKGYSEADVNAALESQRKMVSGAVTDYKAGDITSAVAQAETLDEAYRQGQLTVEEYDEAKSKNSKVIMENINKGMERIEDTDYRALGISEEEWNALEDGEKKLTVFDRIGQLVKSGVVNETDYVKMLSEDLDEEFSSKEYKESDTQLRDAMDSALVIQDLYDSGYLRDDSYKYLLYEKIVPQFEGTRFWEVLDTQDKSLGEEKEYKRGSNPFNAIENYNSAQSYGSPMTAKTSKSLSHDHKELLLKIVRERRKAIREHAAGKGAKGATRA